MHSKNAMRAESLLNCLLYAFTHCYTLYDIVIQEGKVMRNEMLSTRIDHDTKAAFTSICDEVGLSTSQAIKLFAKAVINHGGIPFDLRVPQPNDVTAAAIQELVEGKGHKVESVEAMLSELTEGKVSNV